LNKSQGRPSLVGRPAINQECSLLKVIAAVSAEFLNFIEALQLAISKRIISSPLGYFTRVGWAPLSP